MGGISVGMMFVVAPGQGEKNKRCSLTCWVSFNDLVYADSPMPKGKKIRDMEFGGLCSVAYYRIARTNGQRLNKSPNRASSATGTLVLAFGGRVSPAEGAPLSINVFRCGCLLDELTSDFSPEWQKDKGRAKPHVRPGLKRPQTSAQARHREEA